MRLRWTQSTKGITMKKGNAIYVILCRWEQIFGPLATNEKLIRGFLAAERADLAGDVASELRESVVL